MKDVRSVIESFMTGISVGQVDDALLTDNMTFWSVNGGEADKQRFLGGIAFLAKAANHSIRYEIQSVIADGDRAVSEIHSTGTLINGDELENDHVFLFAFRDGKIAQVREFMNQLVVKDKVVPVMEELMRQAK